MRYLRPKTAPNSSSSVIPRDAYLYESKNAGLGARDGPNRDLFIERQEASGNEHKDIYITVVHLKKALASQIKMLFKNAYILDTFKVN